MLNRSHCATEEIQFLFSALQPYPAFRRHSLVLPTSRKYCVGAGLISSRLVILSPDVSGRRICPAGQARGETTSRDSSLNELYELHFVSTSLDKSQSFLCHLDLAHRLQCDLSRSCSPTVARSYLMKPGHLGVDRIVIMH